MTEKKAANELKSILKDSPDSIFVHSLDVDLIYANKTAHETQSYNKNGLYNSQFNEIDHIIHNNLLTHYNDLISNGSTSFEFSQICSDGSLIDLDVDSNIMESEDDSIILSIVREDGETDPNKFNEKKYMMPLKILRKE